MATYKPLDFLGYPGYRVGDDGSVWCCLVRRRIGRGKGTKSEIGPDWRLLKPIRNNPMGHLAVHLSRKSKAKTYQIHTLVLLAFVGLPPAGKQCRHFPDRNPANNRLENLSWGTVTENQRDRFQHGTSNRGEGNSQAKMTGSRVRKLRLLRGRGWKYSALAQRFGIAKSTAKSIALRKSWKHVP